MNLQNFLESGLLESYILGQCSPEESGIVAQMLAEHEMARKEKAAIESALEQYAQARAIAPPEWMRGRILDHIGTLAPAPLVPPPPIAPTGGMNFRALMSGVLLVAAGLAAYMYYNANDRVQQLESEKAQIQLQAQNCEQERANSQQAAEAQMAFLTHPATRGFKMIWVDPTISAPEALAMAFYNPEEGGTYLRLTQLPVLRADQDYQFWVVIEGIPDAQPLDVIRYQDSVLIKTEFRNKALGFAVSLEPKGGSPNGAPTKVVMAAG